LFELGARSALALNASSRAGRAHERQWSPDDGECGKRVLAVRRACPKAAG
jgi:hypothetical protein